MSIDEAKNIMKYCVPVWAAALLLLSCNETTVALTLKVYGQGAGYTGVYQIDDADNEVSFSGAESTSGAFIYTTEVEIQDRIVIDVFPATSDDDETDMTDLTCRIMDADGNTVYEESYSITSTLMKTFTYNLDAS